VVADVYIDCNSGECIRRFFGSEAGLLEGMTAEMVRRAARDQGWQVNVRRRGGRQEPGRRNPRLDFCPACRGERKT
jgi:hypothetical protein